VGNKQQGYGAYPSPAGQQQQQQQQLAGVEVSRPRQLYDPKSNTLVSPEQLSGRKQSGRAADHFSPRDKQQSANQRDSQQQQHQQQQEQWRTRSHSLGRGDGNDSPAAMTRPSVLARPQQASKSESSGGMTQSIIKLRFLSTVYNPVAVLTV
jgi:hypothetical protein